MATQKIGLPDAPTARAETQRTIADIYNQPYQDHAFDPPIGGGGGGGVLHYNPQRGLYGDNNLNTVGADSIQIGQEAVAQGSSSIAIGAYASTETATNAVSIGYSTNIDGTVEKGVAIGYRTAVVAGGTRSIAIGADVTVGNSDSVVIGSAASLSGNDSVIIGRSANSGFLPGSEQVVAIGAFAVGDGYGAVAVGGYARVINNSYRGIAIGNKSRALHANATVIGQGIDSPSANSFTFGFYGDAAYTISFDSIYGQPTADTPTGTHVLPILINGARYYIMLTNVAP